MSRSHLRWIILLLGHLIWLGVVNRSWALSVLLAGLLLVGLVIAASAAAAPFIYTLF